MDGSSQTHSAADAPVRASERIARREFITFQLVFWGAFLFIRAIGAAIYLPDVFLGFMGQRLVLVAFYAAATTGIHILAMRFSDWTPFQRLTLALIACGAVSFPLHLLENAFALTVGANAPQDRFFEYFAQFGWIFAAWAGYYYALDLMAEARSQARALASAQKKESAARQQMLRYQLNPHFLFNSLNAISTLVLEGRNADAEKMILGLSRFLRHTIDTDVTQLSRLEDEVRIQCLYLDIEAARFGDRLKIKCKMQDGLGDCLVPSLLLQPIVENAIKHGVAHISQQAWLRITTESSDARLRFIIEDNGPGPPEDAHMGGVGLRNTRERLSAIYGDAASLTLSKREEGGARAVFDLPLLRAR